MQGISDDSVLVEDVFNALETGPSKITMETESRDIPDPDAQMSPDEIKEKISRLNEELIIELSRIIDLGKSLSTPEEYANVLQRLVHRLRAVKNPSQAVTAMISLSSRASCVSRRAKRIKTQATSRSRRWPGISRGARRVPSWTSP